jgi:hypothetical protein
MSLALIFADELAGIDRTNAWRLQSIVLDFPAVQTRGDSRKGVFLVT